MGDVLMARRNVTNTVDLYEHLTALPGIEVFLHNAESIYGTEGWSHRVAVQELANVIGHSFLPDDCGE
jgi:hypothetical protein